MGRDYYGPTKKRLYLSHPEPDIVTTRRRITTFIPPPSPPRREEPPPCIVEPEPPCVIEPPPVCLPEPEPEAPIEVISVDVEPRRRHKSRSRSRDRRSSHDKEVYIERDHYIPVPVHLEPQYETYRYVDGPRRPAPRPEPERKLITDGGDVHVHIQDRHRSHDYYRR